MILLHKTPVSFSLSFFYPELSLPLSASGRVCVKKRGVNRVYASYKMDGNISTLVDEEASKISHVLSMDGTEDPCIWSSPEGGQEIDIRKQIFCNRSLNMKGIVSVGFDMDYTLAQYKAETFESLAYEGTIKKLVYDLGYPSDLLEWSFDWTYMVRGLVLDKKERQYFKDGPA
ncbi:unnamed protein product [Rhodiola kirilowii]